MAMTQSPVSNLSESPNEMMGKLSWASILIRAISVFSSLPTIVARNSLLSNRVTQMLFSNSSMT